MIDFIPPEKLRDESEGPPPLPLPRLTLEAVPQVAAPQHPGVEAQRLPVLRAEEALRGDLQRVQRQSAGALRVRPGVLQHHLRTGWVQSPPTAPLEAGTENPGRVQRLRKPERRGPDGLVPGAAVTVRVLPDQRLDGEAFLTAAVLEHDGAERRRKVVKRVTGRNNSASS